MLKLANASKPGKAHVLEAGQLLVAPQNEWRFRASAGDVLLVSYVQPEAESPTPWLRIVEIVANGRMHRTDSSTVLRLIRHGDLVPVQDAPQPSTMSARR